MKQEDLIREACIWAAEHGYQIRRGCLFDWTKPGEDGIPVRSEQPTACDATGAVLLKNGLGEKFSKEGMYKGWVADLCKILDVDGFWLYRFWMGFDRNFQILIVVDEKHSKTDETARLGIQIAKDFV